MKTLTFIFFVLSLLCACEVDVSDEFKNQQNLIVVSGRLVAGEPAQINLSRTITMTEVDTLVFLNDARIELIRYDSTFVMDHVGEGFYENESLLPSPGDILQINCSSEGMPPATVLATFPDPPMVTDIRFSVDEIFDFTLELDLEDPSLTNDYYTIYLSGWQREILHHHNPDTGEEWTDTSNIFGAYGIRITDPIMEYTGISRNFNFYDITYPNGRYFHFSDRLIDGKSHSLSVKQNLRFIYNDSIPELYVHIVKRDVHYYNFLESYILYDPYPDQDFIQPVQVYSNIVGGFGLLTAESSLVDTINLSEWFNDPEFQEYVNPVDVNTR